MLGIRILRQEKLKKDKLAEELKIRTGELAQYEKEFMNLPNLPNMGKTYELTNLPNMGNINRTYDISKNRKYMNLRKYRRK